ncbi:MAG: hypothetical protein KBD66_01565 [Candidatus Doudnabacteria bacterium]|nr:hypothetical protein [Candidatus Doudnabacteria bacterium]
MWRVLKIVCVLILLLWGITIPLSDTARPGSVVYSVNITVTEPVWAWAHLTQVGRSEQWALQLERRYQDILRAGASGEDWQLQGALRAEALTFLRIRRELARATSSLQAKPAYALAAQANGLVWGYGQVFEAQTVNVGDSLYRATLGVESNFFSERKEILASELERLGAVLSGGLDKQDLVRGLDEQLRAMDEAVAHMLTVYGIIAPSIPSELSEDFRDAVVQLQNESAYTRVQVAQDYYADGYKTSARVQGKALALLSVWYGLSVYSIAAPPVLW